MESFVRFFVHDLFEKINQQLDFSGEGLITLTRLQTSVTPDCEYRLKIQGISGKICIKIS
jgi:hypothetical protein